MKSELSKGKNFTLYLCEGSSTNKDRPYHISLNSEYVWPTVSKKELENIVNFINQYLENDHE